MATKTIKDFKDTPTTLRKLDTTKLATGTKVGQYVIMNEIDRGGMAVVYKARQLGLDREVALKVLPPSISLQSKFTERFAKEARAIAQLTHPNIVRIIEVGGDAGIYFIAMEFLDGLNLYKYMVRFEPTVYTVIQIIKQLADALEYAHSRNIIHRDLKLNNVIMKDNAIPILIDFGLAKAREADSGVTISGEIIGSPSYMSPEQALGNHVDERTDIYSLGIMAYELLTSKNPFFDKRGYQQTIWNVIHGEARPPREVSDWIPRDIEVIIMKALEKDREKRYQTMRAFRMDLERYQAGEPILARSPSILEHVVRQVRKRKGLFMSVAAITILLALFGSYYRYQTNLEKADWKEVRFEADMYTNLDQLWEGKHDGEDLKFISMDSPWVGSSGRIQVSADGYTWITWRRKNSNDMRLEFTIEANRDQNREFGFFINGTDPETGYTFRFLNDGIYLSKKSRQYIINRIQPRLLKKGEHVRIRAEKDGYRINLFVNNRLKMSFDDYTPLSSSVQNSMGFYVDNGSVILSDIMLYQLGVPLKTQPIETADRFFEHRYFKDAIDEYLTIAALYPNDPMAVRAQYKIGLSYMEMGELETAISEFENILRTKNNNLIPSAMGQIVRCYTSLGDDFRAEKMLLRLRDRYPDSPTVIALLSETSSRLIGIMAKDKPALSAVVEERLDFLMKNFAPQERFFIDAHMAFGEWHLKWRDYAKAKKIFESIEKGYLPGIDQAVIASVRIGDIEAYTGSLSKAVEKYNTILSLHHANGRACAESWMGIGWVDRALCKADDALKSYDFVIKEFGYFRDLGAKATINNAFVYLEKTVPEKASEEIFKRVLQKYRDYDAETCIARFMLGLSDEKELARKFAPAMLNYYIAERYRYLGDKRNAIVYFSKFKKDAGNNQLLIRLVESQMAYVR
ncbi:MAG: hypothetical protein A2268_04930 [Candidatus Raymondbacteria bacterium RifOxyA12_full_50_37]|uniref:Protein kinase domain-containing protein n=1 Tax=Candidatus Raymondbacteria bacterium RIFOXYD12_FULL_49_13 TaxID=1817890 RepID=A0A1F7FD82_UNCRA|nr:MAG: hypothetical protein A2268_04930 [Candidatus Raymondbacteria bacterium RifOxyA12_full_50_37]OGJ94088.1 MAG: hypothetical protein A2248_12135 [Candidatus Raymondbacteria bacterium RIFOXYA2_FULL_49_16]OGJ96913.1 MAG: hypothetical protein A2453_04735 [Candidatus Raymondbacteria bacterium RIFOXYC2_FULL_50_21]OGK03015.1 MAG: hypothetical protein A2350_03600 [Candidatus Raymondbacteria bacterium RifOxyB12_full_50_8]OGK04639.1 MAG: hypothetical protein A2519_20900 [Candidatus Raymondbacteria b